MGNGLLNLEQDDGDHEDGEFVGKNFFEALPEGFLANALALNTTPRDVCRLSLVNSVFRSAAGWDVLWEKFLPEDYHKLVLDAAVRFGSKKELYLWLCDHPVIIDGGNKSFWLDKWSGKKCYMLAARDLSIVWGDTPRYWRWISLPESRFAEVAELKSVCWLEVHGTINTSMLSIDTCYAAYLVYKSTPNTYGFEHYPAEVYIGLSGVESQSEDQTKTVFLDPAVRLRQRDDQEQQPGRRIGMFGRFRRMRNQSDAGPPLNGPKPRQDGWLEIELGEFFYQKGEEGELEMTMMEVKGGNWKGGLIVQGIEIRPKAS